jgi:hypothetical protein
MRARFSASLPRTVDPAIHQPVAHLVVGRRRRRRVVLELRDHLLDTVQLLLDRRRPVNLGMQKPLQAHPVLSLDRIEHVAYRWDLLGHRLAYATGAPCLCSDSVPAARSITLRSRTAPVSAEVAIAAYARSALETKRSRSTGA